jgi:hypothetical protein
MNLVMKFGTHLRGIERFSQELCRWQITPQKSIGLQFVEIVLVGDQESFLLYKQPNARKKLHFFVKAVISPCLLLSY